MAMVLFSDLPSFARQSEEAMVDFAFSCLPQAAVLARVPYSGFCVGAVAIDERGNFYFGTNQEYESFLAQTVHAEQSAVANAWCAGVERLRHMVVNYSPCGHCRQFLMELLGARELLIHTPKQRFQPLSFYLPNAFSGEDLEVEARIFKKSFVAVKKPEVIANDALLHLAWEGFVRSHAPYSRRPAGAAIALKNGEMFWGAYLESAAFNPSLPALQVALNGVHLQGFSAQDVARAVLVASLDSGHWAQAKALWAVYSDAPFEFVAVD